MQPETRTCKNCNANFVVDNADFTFYETMQVPPPTFCPECRMIRRMAMRNERALYKRNCDMCKKSVISMYAPERDFVVYCTECYQSDNWDPLSYATDFDFTKTFTEQRAELLKRVPRRALYQDSVEGSDYTNWAVYVKNSYLVFGGHHYEDVSYASSCLYLTRSLDMDFSKNSELCYESIHLKKCNTVFHSAYSEECTSSWFLFGCRNVHDCIGCVNLRNTSYCIFNVQYSKEEYLQKLAELNINTRTGRAKVADQFKQHLLTFPQKFAWVRNIQNSTGDDLENVKDCKHCFSAFEDENVRYAFFAPTGAKDCYDIDHVGLGAELSYELLSGFGTNRVAFCNRVYYSHDVQYSDDCFNSEYLFGCIGIKKKEYCIFNKQYTKEEYDVLVAKIRAHMMAEPSVNEQQREYGEFFPVSISPFAYNETTAQEYFPLTKELALQKGYSWYDGESKGYETTKEVSDLPESIAEVGDDILNEVIRCPHNKSCHHQCASAFRITAPELAFYRDLNLPLPELCPNCRHYERLARRNPPKLWSGTCHCAGTASSNGLYKNNMAHATHGDAPCPVTFVTSFDPARPEITYCEQCYQAEVS